MFCALESENKKSGSNPGGRGKQWVKAWKKREKNGEDRKQARQWGGAGGGRGRGESEKYEAIMGEKRVLLLNLSRVVFTFSS